MELQDAANLPPERGQDEWVNFQAVSKTGNVFGLARDGKLYCRTPDNRTFWKELVTGNGTRFSHLELNSDNTLLLLWSNQRVAILELAIKYSDDNIFLRDIFILSESQTISKSGFHPFSSRHILVLSSNEVLIFDGMNPQGKEPEKILMPLVKPGMEFTSYCFGPNIDWLGATIFLLCKNGDIYVMNPLLPKGAIVPSAVLSEMEASIASMSAKSREDAVDFLRDLFGPPTRRDLRSYVVAEEMNSDPYISDEIPIRVTELQGPLSRLNRNKPVGVEAVEICFPSNKADASPNGGLIGSPILFVAFSNGDVDILLLKSEDMIISPKWRKRTIVENPPVPLINPLNECGSLPPLEWIQTMSWSDFQSATRVVVDPRGGWGEERKDSGITGGERQVIALAADPGSVDLLTTI